MKSKTVEVEYFSFGKLIDADKPKGDFALLSCTHGFSIEKAESYFARASIGSYSNLAIEKLSDGYSLVEVDTNTYLFCCVSMGPVRDRGHIYPHYDCWVISLGDMLLPTGGNIDLLLALTKSEFTRVQLSSYDYDLPSQKIELVVMSEADELIELRRLSSHLGIHQNNDLFDKIFQLLSLILNYYPITIIDMPDDESRIELVKFFWLLLPSSSRHRISFATQVFESTVCRAIVKFLHPKAIYNRNELVYSWIEGKFQNLSEASLHPYVEFLKTNWSDQKNLLKVIHESNITLQNIRSRITISSEARSMDPLYVLGTKQIMPALLRDHILPSKALEILLSFDPTLNASQKHKYAFLLFNFAIEQKNMAIVDALIEQGWIKEYVTDVAKEISRRLIGKQYPANTIFLLRHLFIISDSPSGVRLSTLEKLLRELMNEYEDKWKKVIKIFSDTHDRRVFIGLTNLYFSIGQYFNGLTLLSNLPTLEESFFVVEGINPKSINSADFDRFQAAARRVELAPLVKVKMFCMLIYYYFEGISEESLRGLIVETKDLWVNHSEIKLDDDFRIFLLGYFKTSKEDEVLLKRALQEVAELHDVTTILYNLNELIRLYQPI